MTTIFFIRSVKLASGLTREALRLSDKVSTDNTAFDRCIATAKHNDLTYIEGLRDTDFNASRLLSLFLVPQPRNAAGAARNPKNLANFNSRLKTAKD